MSPFPSARTPPFSQKVLVWLDLGWRVLHLRPQLREEAPAAATTVGLWPAAGRPGGAEVSKNFSPCCWLLGTPRFV